MGFINGLFGIAATALNNAMGKEREEEARKSNYTYNELSASNADKRQRALYEDYYSPSAQLGQIRAAGLSPSLFFGSGGGGMGATPQGAQGDGGYGIMPNTQFLDPMFLAELDLKKAQSENIQADTDTKQGKNERGQAEIAGLIAQNLNTEQRTRYNKYQADGQEILNYINKGSQDFQISIFEKQAERLQAEINNIIADTNNKNLEYDFNSETYKDRVKTVQEQLKQIVADITLKNSQSKLNQEQTWAIGQQVLQGWQQLQATYEHLINERTYNINQNQYWLASVKNFEKQLELVADQNAITNKGNWIKGISNIIGAGIAGAALWASKKLTMPLSVAAGVTPNMKQYGYGTFNTTATPF